MTFVGPTALWRLGALFCTGGMVSNAIGTHALQSRGYSATQIHSWEAGSSYAIYNGLALLLISSQPRFANYKFSGLAIAIGGAIFSGSIIALVLNRERFRRLGPVTPIGGTIMILGYFSLAF